MIYGKVELENSECNNQILNHCEKNAQIWRFFRPVFSRIWTEYGDLLRIQSKHRIIQTRKNTIFAHFSRSEPVSQDVRNFEDKHTPFRELQNLPLKIPEKTIVG